MKTLLKMLEALRGEKGQTIIEYILVIVLISLVLILVVTGTGPNTVYNGLQEASSDIGNKLSGN